MNCTIPIDLRGYEICMILRKKYGGEWVFTFPIVDNDISSDPENGKVTILKFYVELKPFNYYYDILLTDTNDNSLTWSKGYFPVMPVITKKCN